MADRGGGTGGPSDRRDEELRLLRGMLRIRELEKKIDLLFKRGLVKGTCHLGIGQEAIPVALCRALRPSDLAAGTHRGHGLALAKGVDPVRLLAEILGRASGVCGGRGGSQHVASAEHGFLGTNGITGGGLSLAAGAALACASREDGRIVAVTLGDGATNEGVFHETLNVSALWKLPVLYVCENNLYGMSTPIEKASSEPLLWKRAAAYRIEALRVDGNDLEALLPAFGRAVDLVRSGGGPVFVECMTYRWMGHSKSDPRAYRAREEEETWRRRCPIRRWAERLEASGTSPDEISAMQSEVAAEMETAANRALEAPPAGPEGLHDHVFAG